MAYSGALLAAASAQPGGGEKALFFVIAPLMVLGALGLLTVRKAVHAALCMALVMVSLGIVYLAEQAPFLGVVQIFVYTGAVMMLFLFVLMLIGIDSSDSLVETIKGQRFLAVVFGLGITVLLIAVLRQVVFGEPAGLADVNAGGNVSGLAAKIFGPYVWAFEVTGALLITAALGAMVLAHRERLTPRLTQRELSVRRIRDGVVKAPLPAPGVFARHNAVDTPALLPDGTPSPLSVSRVLSARGQMRDEVSERSTVATIEAEITDPLAADEPEGPADDEKGTPA
ncbi:MAG TPA: NADH-quinone oxidoreductase subunit J [Kineosporiaceae bacterium]|nr:NADH-quinone oxidoreductase subunit J [Kineosporiaceae bacterium]